MDALPPGWRLVALETVDSTNAEALRRAAAGAAPGTVVWARAQTAGRGRGGRPWRSPAGNLHMSLIVRPPPGRPAGQLAFVAALATADAIDAVLPPPRRVRLKWPNDVLLDDAKLAGILIEASGRAAFVVGIGVNIAVAPALDGRAAAALADAGATVSPRALLAGVCQSFAVWSARWAEEGFAPLRAAWLARAHGLGAAVEARLPARTLRGRFDGLDAEGALLLGLPDGRREALTAGEVFFTAPG